METQPTPEMRAAYRGWLLADQAATSASDDVLRLIQSGQALANLDELERLSARALECRAAADRALTNAVAALPLTSETDSDPARSSEDAALRMVDVIRTVVDLEVHHLGERGAHHEDHASAHGKLAR